MADDEATAPPVRFRARVVLLAAVQRLFSIFFFAVWIMDLAASFQTNAKLLAFGAISPGPGGTFFWNGSLQLSFFNGRNFSPSLGFQSALAELEHWGQSRNPV